jgi:hypothetical protein
MLILINYYNMKKYTKEQRVKRAKEQKERYKYVKYINNHCALLVYYFIFMQLLSFLIMLLKS